MDWTIDRCYRKGNTRKTAGEQINKIAEHGKTTGLYKHAVAKSKEYGEGVTAVQCFKDMVYKVATAPTQIHARGAVFLIMPVIAEKLNEGSNSNLHDTN